MKNVGMILSTKIRILNINEKEFLELYHLVDVDKNIENLVPGQLEL